MGRGTRGAVRAWVAAMCVLVAYPARADVAFETASSTTAGNVTSLIVSHMVGTGANRYLVVAVAFAPPSASVASARAASKALIRLGTRSSGACRTELWGLAAPDSGNQLVTVDFNGSTSAIAMGVTSYTGVNQQDPTGNFASHTGNGGSPQDLSVSVAIQAGDFTVDVLCGSTGGSAPSPSVGDLQTQRWRRSMGGLTGVGSTQPNITSDGRATMSWSLSGSGNIDWSIATVPLNPAPPAPPPDAGPDVAPDVAPDLAPDLAPDVAEPDLAPDVAAEDVAPDAEVDAGAPDAWPDAASPDLAPPEEDSGAQTAEVNLRVGCACNTGGRGGGGWPLLLLAAPWWRSGPRPRRRGTTDPWRTPLR